MTTASSACAAIDLASQNSNRYTGRVLQEQFSLNDILNTSFGEYLKVTKA